MSYLALAEERLTEAWTSLLFSFLTLATWDFDSGLEWTYTLAGDTPAVTLGLVCTATGYTEGDLAALAIQHGIPLGLGKPGAAYASAAQLDPDDTLPCVPLEHLPYLLFCLNEKDAHNFVDQMSIYVLRDKAQAVIVASECVPGAWELPAAYQRMWTNRREVIN